MWNILSKIENMKIFLLLFFMVLQAVCFVSADQNNLPKLLLAKTYKSDIELKNYWVSEKLDGVRAYWDGHKLISRGGNIFNAPEWFIKSFPDHVLDGELWISRGSFEVVSGIVRRKSVNTDDWRKVKYMLFDLPGHAGLFNQRLIKLKKLVKDINVNHLQVIPQYKIADHETLINKLETIVKQGGEGLMLHAGASYYHGGRSKDLLKLKKFLDAEAIVIKHIPGKGKYTGMLGAILVETSEKIQFKIGSGFSDEERKNPPKIGEMITFKYTGLSRKGVPRFASFLRVRKGH